jgi:hypothetical protein
MLNRALSVENHIKVKKLDDKRECFEASSLWLFYAEATMRLVVYICRCKRKGGFLAEHKRSSSFGSPDDVHFCNSPLPYSDIIKTITPGTLVPVVRL